MTRPRLDSSPVTVRSASTRTPGRALTLRRTWPSSSGRLTSTPVSPLEPRASRRPRARGGPCPACLP
ncbi:hypothetical protein ACFQQB_45675 [Nonomuraea rubra]|uniref:hypothetical protein n=1 Tax=Nonomuraea rubra TaxID=46180 RepID=UPI00362320DC